MVQIWRDDPDLKGRFHPDYPDNLQIVILTSQIICALVFGAIFDLTADDKTCASDVVQCLCIIILGNIPLIVL
jgi:hypothetical protein